MPPGVYAALILAAGAASRMGGDVPKQLLTFRGRTLLDIAIATAREVPAEQVIVVLGHQAERILPTISEQPHLTVVVNTQWHEGVSSSLRGGLAAVSPEARGVFIYPADMPLITPDLLRDLARRQQESGRPGTMTETNGVRGVPVLVTRSLFPALMIQEGDRGGAQYLRAHPDLVEVVRPSSPDVVRDVDRPEDYERLQELDPDFDPDRDLRAGGGG